jgi:hypothetical protein
MAAPQSLKKITLDFRNDVPKICRTRMLRKSLPGIFLNLKRDGPVEQSRQRRARNGRSLDGSLPVRCCQALNFKDISRRAAPHLSSFA